MFRRHFIFAAMKRLLILVAVLATQLTAHAVDTAYTALRAYGKKEGEKSLHRVLELRGRNGAPQPTMWKIVVDAPDARGGIREIDVQNGRIVGQRTPVSRDVGQVMNFNQLNLDSDGAFTVVNQEAGKRRTTFDRLDYSLRGGSKGGAPIWEIELYEKGNRVGVMRIAADSGEILEQDFSPQRTYADDRTYLDDNTAPPDRRPPDYSDDRGDGSATLPGFANRVGRHFQKRGRQLERFFTGK